MKVAKGRVVVRTDCIYDRMQHGAKAWGSPHSFPVDSDEEAYDRTIKVSPDWQIVDTSWVTSPSLLWLHNVPEPLNVNPTPEQAKAAEALVIEVTISGHRTPLADFLLRPGRDMHVEPTRPLLVRCSAGTARMRIIAVPSNERAA